MEPQPARILVVDDEEAILETMTFTFQDDYEVFTSTDARRALDILDANAPFAAVLSDQRMPDMSGVEFVTEVCRRHPLTVRMILTGFSDMDAIIKAINDGHVYSYITKPWEPDQLKQLMKQAVDHYALARENQRLLTDLQHANQFLGAVMDQLDTGAIAVDADGLIQAANRPVCNFLKLESDPRGKALKDVLEHHELDLIGAVAMAVADDEEVGYLDVDVGSHRFRVTSNDLEGESGEIFGRVILFREISHEPLRRQFDALVAEVGRAEGELRPILETLRDELPALAQQVGDSEIASAGMSELGERVSRTRTAVENWLEVDDALAREGFPDAHMLQDRIRVASARWPLAGEIPARVQALGRAVEEYYESGEKAGTRVL